MDYQNRISKEPKDIRTLIKGYTGLTSRLLSDSKIIFINGDYLADKPKRKFSFFKKTESSAPQRVDEQVELFCKNVVKADVGEVLWWPVYNHTDSTGIEVFSINSQSSLSEKTSRAGFILVTKLNARHIFGGGDNDAYTNDDAAETIEAELSEYSIWFNTPKDKYAS